MGHITTYQKANQCTTLIRQNKAVTLPRFPHYPLLIPKGDGDFHQAESACCQSLHLSREYVPLFSRFLSSHAPLEKSTPIEPCCTNNIGLVNRIPTTVLCITPKAT